MANWLKARQLREGGYSLTLILVIVLIAVAVNYLAAQYNQTYDATQQKLYSLSDQTHRILGDLESDVTIYFFDRKSRFREAENSLVRYENASSRVDVQYIDPDSQPARAEQFNIRNYGTVLVEVGASREEANSISEQDVTNAIIQSLKGTQKEACFIVGHGEADPANAERLGFAAAQRAIEDANYTTQTINLPQNPSIPGSCSVVIIAGPENAYLEPEANLIREYVAGGGRLLLSLDFEQSAGLTELASEWGVNVQEDVVIDRSGIGQLLGTGPLTPVAGEYDSTHPITEVMRSVATLFPMTRSITSADDTGDWTVDEIIKTTEASFATSDYTFNGGELDLGEDPQLQQGPINVVAAGSRQVEAAPEEAAAEGDEEEAETETEEEEPESLEARVVVTGTSRFARNYMLGAGANRDLFLNMLNWLTSDEDLISIRPTDPENTPITMTRAGMTRIFWGLVVGLPLVIVLGGFRMWWVRR